MSGGMALLLAAAAFSLKKTHTCCCLGPCLDSDRKQQAERNQLACCLQGLQAGGR
jgi:hypothetical protein